MEKKRKLYFAGGVITLLGLIAFAGAIPRFDFVHAHIGKIIDAIVYVTIMFMAGNVGEHVAPYLPKVLGKN